MIRELRAFIADSGGSTSLENMLWIALFVLAVGTGVTTLATAMNAKLQDMANKVSGVGIP